MVKPSLLIYNTVQCILLLYLIYCLITIIQHLVIPNISELTIKTVANAKDPQIQEIILSPQKKSNEYYVFIYEESEKNNWSYSVTQTYDKERQKLANQFLPKETLRYILLEGNKKKSSLTFSLKPKYPVNYITRKKSIFHAIYLVPYRIYPFSKFYYCKDYTFFIEELR